MGDQFYQPNSSLSPLARQLIDALNCPALGHPATVRAAAGTVALTTANDVFLDTVQRDKKIFGSVSITSWIQEHGGAYRGFREIFPAPDACFGAAMSEDRFKPPGRAVLGGCALFYPN
jgi:hypothetical protein